jgi:hypothetical protein
MHAKVDLFSIICEDNLVTYNLYIDKIYNSIHLQWNIILFWAAQGPQKLLGY